MFKKFYIYFLVVLLFTGKLSAEEKPFLIFYVGSTMSRAMNEIAKVIEKRYDCNIDIVTGASKTLYSLIKTSKKGDLYLPGSNSFRKNNLKDGYLKDAVYVGYNKACIFVKYKNPKNVKTLDDLLDENLAVMLCDPSKGSIGRETEKLLKKYKGKVFLDDVYNNSVRIALDSKDLYSALKNDKVDAVINWKATMSWSKQKKFTLIKIDDRFSPKKKLYISLLSFSKYPMIERELMKYTASPDGQKIMKKYGFLD